MRVLMARCAHRFKKVPESRAFTRWVEFLEEKKWVLSKIDYIHRRIKYRNKAEPFQRWVEAVFESQELRAKLVHALQRLKHGAMARSWTAWSDAADEAAAKREGAEAVLTRRKQRELVGAFDRWYGLPSLTRRRTRAWLESVLKFTLIFTHYKMGYKNKMS